MKKQLVLTVIVLFLIILDVIGQDLSGKITYNVSLNLTIEQITERNKAIGRKVSQSSIDMINNARDILAYLEFNNIHSIQKTESKLKTENIRKINKTRAGAGYDKVFYTSNSLTQKNNILECKVLGECFLIEQPKAKWKITQISKLIGGYLCYKAIYETPLYQSKKPVAWFTPQIPARYGPKIFSGLPGLILELEDNTVTFTAIKIELNPKEKIKIKKPKGIAITKEKYDALLRKKFPEFYKKWEAYKKEKKS